MSLPIPNNASSYSCVKDGHRTEPFRRLLLLLYCLVCDASTANFSVDFPLLNHLYDKSKRREEIGLWNGKINVPFPMYLLEMLIVKIKQFFST